MKIPFLRPNPPKFKAIATELESIEQSGCYSNFGPQNSLFEEELRDQIFAGRGYCLTVCNATIGLILAIKEALDSARNQQARYALVPAFTFAATAHAVLWCGLKPILYDIDPKNWLPSASEEERLLLKHGRRIGVVVPYATFGNCLDLDRYAKLQQRHDGVPIIVDAAASIGSVDATGRGFGTGSNFPLVYSMHVTKTFSTSEGGVIYCSDADRIAKLRAMSNFGFSTPRTAGLPGLNAKLSEVAAVIARAELRNFKAVSQRRAEIYSHYASLLSNQLEFQSHAGRSVISQFLPVLLPKDAAINRDDIMQRMQELGITVAKYFSPHLAEQPYFAASSMVAPLPTTEDVASRILCLPMSDNMLIEEIEYVARSLLDFIE